MGTAAEQARTASQEAIATSEEARTPQGSAKDHIQLRDGRRSWPSTTRGDGVALHGREQPAAGSCFCCHTKADVRRRCLVCQHVRVVRGHGRVEGTEGSTDHAVRMSYPAIARC